MGDFLGRASGKGFRNRLLFSAIRITRDR